MKGKFGGKQPTGTPSLAWSTVVVVVSLLAGASVVHNIFKPDLVLLLLLSRICFFLFVSVQHRFLSTYVRTHSMVLECAKRCFRA
ncbi:putative protein BRAWNIN [Helianthus annuus]|nr:putative protein BRAWNIN [Helianthus annuus]KAJ0553076.1 putative protein BRAWNIN [Helianthus annuus]KAJ0718765.1 putative protein BRAWNIN [Helianthus annuus]KAJ0721994.1 putative protein BRAWNIN [Helianthus annuus]